MSLQQRQTSEQITEKDATPTSDIAHKSEEKTATTVNVHSSASSDSEGSTGRDLFHLVFYVLGIYASFLTWAVLQERISTTPYGGDMRIFRASNAISAIQSLLASVAGLLFLVTTNETANVTPRNWQILKGYTIVALCQTLSSPFSYASLKYVDYVTMLLAKSCKLVPVMSVHVLLYRARFPLYKYVVVSLVTIGVSMFSLFAASSESAFSKTSGGNAGSASQGWGFFLLGCGLFLDGLYNTTQDQMFQRYGKTREVTGPHMMVILNLLTTVFGAVALFASGQLREALWFAQNHPKVYLDIVLFGLCGALGQIFIFLTLERFGSLVLVTTTVTRKMISMLLSVVMFNHKLTTWQWVGVALVFGGVAGEALYKQLSAKKQFKPKTD